METNSRIYLRKFEKDDLEQVNGWKDDGELAELLGLKLPGEEVDYYRHYQDLMGKRNSRVFAIETQEGQFIGTVELNQITWRRKEAELHICIGDRRYWNRGYGTEAVRAALTIAVEDLGLEEIYLRVYRYNRRAIRCYQKCGFSKEAILRGRFRHEVGRAFDIILMNVRAEDLADNVAS